MNLKCVTVVALAVFSHSALALENVSLGVLEDVPGVYVGESNSTKVRALFTRNAQGWTAFKSDCATEQCLTSVTAEYPKEMAWFIGLDGRQIGRILTRTPSDFRFYAHIGLQDVAEGKPPVVGKPSYDYAGFAGPKVHRPLVANSQPNFRDPAVWKRANITPDLRKQAAALLRKLAPPICKEGASEEGPLLPFNYATKDVLVRAYRSQDGRMLITAIAEGTYYCEGGTGDGAYDAQTFGIDSAEKVQLLGPGLLLVDAGDYDLDGKSELVFSLSLYNRGGYVLLSDDFKEQARFQFGYQ